MARAASIVFADTDTREGLGRVVNALTTAKEFKGAGDEAVVILVWGRQQVGRRAVARGSQVPRPVQGRPGRRGGACSYCASAYGVKELVEQAGVRALEEYEGHPSVRTLMNGGYAVVTLGEVCRLASL